jgi:hypothetical protein
LELYLILLKALLKEESYRLYRKGIDSTYVENNYPDLYRLYTTLDDLQGCKGKDYSLNDLKLRFYTLYPRITPKTFDELFSKIDAVQYDPQVVDDYLRVATDRKVSFELARQAMNVADGRGPVSELIDYLKTVPDQLGGKTVIESDFEIVTDDLEDLYRSTVKSPGLRWRLKSLNSAMGSLRQGNFGFIFARPETGKTTILTSELTYMAEQLPEEHPAVWFNNEQAGKDVKVRMYQAALGITTEELWGDIHSNKAKYEELIKGRLKLVDEGNMSKRFVERVCKALKPGLIVFDQIDKVTGFNADRPDLVLKSIYQWARELSKEYGPTIGVCQAGDSGDGKRYLTMGDVDGSNTAKQGEADWILGIGATYDPGMESVRYLHLSKNKLMGDPDTDPQLRHGKWSCLIHPEIARFKDFDD